MQEILEDEVKKQLSKQVEEELRSKIKQKLTELEQQTVSDISAFNNHLNQLIAEVEKDKREYVAKLTSLDLNIVRETAAKLAADKIVEVFKRARPPFPFRLGRTRD
ncbi:MAG: hypothetical protein HC769_00510 [Cyanobacteria bacterium CRU_2_1]|nr:hypothetical protein [Cyanobacteria bacterium CRU_2_1]